MSRRVVFFLASVAVPGVLGGDVPCGAAAAIAAEPSPLEVFERYIQDRDPALRRKAVSQLADQRGGAVVEALLRALRDEDSLVRDRAEAILVAKRDRSDEIEALAKHGFTKQTAEVRAVAVKALVAAGTAGVPALRTALDDKDPFVRVAAARGIAAAGDRSSAPKLHELLTAREPIVRAAACDAIGEILGAEAVGTASAVALGDVAAEPRIAAVRVLGRFPTADSVAQVARCLVHPSWSLRVAAAESLAEHGVGEAAVREAAKELVDAIGREERRRVKRAMGEALWSLTGIDFGPEPDLWRKWYSEAGRTFDPPKRRPQRAPRAENSTHGGLLDLPLESEHVTFVLDMSSSMNDPVRFGVKTTKREDLVAAFDGVVDRLPKPSWMNLITFATDVKPYKARLFEATPAARSAVTRELAKTQPDGRTNIFDAVETALADGDADTVVLVTDGAPSAGKRTSRSGIIEAVVELNRYRLARVHTVEIGAANTGARWKGFLADISDATGGTHVSR